jgi:hypothetical protein
MIKSKNNTYGYWKTPIMMLLMCGLFTIGVALPSPQKDRNVIMVFSLTLFLLMVPYLWWTSVQVVIDSSNKKISFIHFITRRENTYSFNDFDGYADWIESKGRGGPFRVIYLVRDKRFIRRISSEIYSNIEELESGFKSLKYFGQQQYSYVKSLRVLFGLKVLKE